MVTTIHCTQCGTALPGNAQFCALCGSRVLPPTPGGWDQASVMPATYALAQDFVYAGFWLRFVASIIDSIIVNAVIGVIGAGSGLGVSGLIPAQGGWVAAVGPGLPIAEPVHLYDESGHDHEPVARSRFERRRALHPPEHRDHPWCGRFGRGSPVLGDGVLPAQIGRAHV